MLLDRPAVEDPSPGGFLVREASRGDVGRLREMFSRCSVDTIYERFHTPYAVVPRWMADLMILMEHGEGEAFVAVVGDDLVGHAMYVQLNDREAEVAVVVEDAWQSKGVGGRLLSEAAKRARLRGVGAFVCETLTENRRVPGLSAAVFSVVEREVKGAVALIRVPLSSLGTEERNAR